MSGTDSDAAFAGVDTAAHLDAFEILLDYERRSLAHVAGLPEQL